MRATIKLVFATLGAASGTLVAAALVGAPPTSHAVEPAALGAARAAADMETVVDLPGPVTVTTVIGAEWSVPLSGLLNLEHPTAIAAGLRDRDERIEVVFHAIRHPRFGVFLVDTGVERAIGADPEHALLRGVVGHAMHIERMSVKADTATWIAANDAPAGVFLTHLHIDHITGMRDVPGGTPVYVGPGETVRRAAHGWLVRPITDAALSGKGALREWRFGPDGVLDVFGDGSVWAISVPGHTAGSTAFLARTAAGPVLLTGDACHTAWGWQNGVEPGRFSDDRVRSAASLARLRGLARRHPLIDVRLGHQPLPPPVTSAR